MSPNCGQPGPCHARHSGGRGGGEAFASGRTRVGTGACPSIGQPRRSSSLSPTLAPVGRRRACENNCCIFFFVFVMSANDRHDKLAEARSPRLVVAKAVVHIVVNPLVTSDNSSIHYDLGVCGTCAFIHHNAAVVVRQKTSASLQCRHGEHRVFTTR